MDTNEELKHQMTRAAMSDIDEILGKDWIGIPIEAPIRRLLLLGWLEGARWGLKEGAEIITGRAAEAVMDVLKRVEDD